MIKAENLNKVFRGKKLARVQALQSMSFAIEKGETFGFIGPNGAGKSTTIKILMGLIRPSSGRAEVMGRPAAKPEARRKVGFLPENPAFYDFLSGQEYLRFVGRMFGLNGSDLDTRLEDVLSLMDLQEARKRPIRGYSKGMVQRLGMAQALIHDPDLLVLDEPMSGLDPVGRALVKDVLIDLGKKGKTIFFSTHITTDVEAICDRVGVILKGKMAAVDRVDDILSRQTEGYNVTTRQADSNQEETEFVASRDLNDYLASLSSKGREVVSIAPRRQSIEKYFLDLLDQES